MSQTVFDEYTGPERNFSRPGLTTTTRLPHAATDVGTMPLTEWTPVDVSISISEDGHVDVDTSLLFMSRGLRRAFKAVARAKRIDEGSIVMVFLAQLAAIVGGVVEIVMPGGRIVKGNGVFLITADSSDRKSVSFDLFRAVVDAIAKARGAVLRNAKAALAAEEESEARGRTVYGAFEVAHVEAEIPDKARMIEDRDDILDARRADHAVRMGLPVPAKEADDIPTETPVAMQNPTVEAWLTALCKSVYGVALAEDESIGLLGMMDDPDKGGAFIRAALRAVNGGSYRDDRVTSGLTRKSPYIIATLIFMSQPDLTASIFKTLVASKSKNAGLAERFISYAFRHNAETGDIDPEVLAEGEEALGELCNTLLAASAVTPLPKENATVGGPSQAQPDGVGWAARVPVFDARDKGLTGNNPAGKPHSERPFEPSRFEVPPEFHNVLGTLEGTQDRSGVEMFGGRPANRRERRLRSIKGKLWDRAGLFLLLTHLADYFYEHRADPFPVMWSQAEVDKIGSVTRERVENITEFSWTFLYQSQAFWADEATQGGRFSSEATEFLGALTSRVSLDEALLHNFTPRTLARRGLAIAKDNYQTVTAVLEELLATSGSPMVTRMKVKRTPLAVAFNPYLWTTDEDEIREAIERTGADPDALHATPIKS